MCIERRGWSVSVVSHLLSGPLRRGLKETFSLVTRGPWQENFQYTGEGRSQIERVEHKKSRDHFTFFFPINMPNEMEGRVWIIT